MIKLTVQDMVTRVRDMMNEDVAGFWTDASIIANLNEGYRFIAALCHCIQDILSKSTTVSTRVIAFDGYKVHYIEYLGVKGISVRKIVPKSLGQQPTTLGRPQFFFSQDQNIILDPVPDAVYPVSVYVSTYPTAELTNIDDVTSLPISYDLIVVYYATMKSFFEEGNFAAAKSMESLVFAEMQFNEVDKSTYFVEDTHSIKAPSIRTRNNERG